MQLDKPDALSSLIAGLRLQSEVYVYGDFCGAWAVDTSGSRHMPFHLVEQGSAWLHIEGRPARALAAGDLVLFPRDLRHAIAYSEAKPDQFNQAMDTAEEASARMICGFYDFQSKASWPLLDSLPDVVVFSLNLDGLGQATKVLINLAVSELNSPQPGQYQVVNQLLYVVFINILRQQIAEGLEEGLLAALFHPKIGKSLAALHQSPAQQWSLDSLADSANMGRSSFAKTFADLVGMTPVKYLSAWRLQLASDLLRSTNRSIAEIAESCGYQSEVVFRKAYKKTLGHTPGDTRRQAQ